MVRKRSQAPLPRHLLVRNKICNPTTQTIFGKTLVTKQSTLLVHIDFDRRKTLLKICPCCGLATVWISTFFKIAFMFSRRKNFNFQIYLYSTFKKQPRLTKVLHNVRKSFHTNKMNTVKTSQCLDSTQNKSQGIQVRLKK